MRAPPNLLLICHFQINKVGGVNRRMDEDCFNGVSDYGIAIYREPSNVEGVDRIWNCAI
jgi:hypothetical protein